MKKEFLGIEGMHCNSCAKLIESALDEKGVVAAVDFEKKKAKVAYDEEKINIEEIISIIQKEGYKASRVSR